MAVDERVIEKIRKLLALATSPNEHEAASAAAKAQALMLEHDLAAGDIDVRTGLRVTGVERRNATLRQRGKPGGWKIDLYKAVAVTSDCHVWAYETHGEILGRTMDVEMAEYLYAFLVAQLERLQDEYGKERWADLADYARREGLTTHQAEQTYSAMGTHPLRAKQSWIKGAVISVIEDLTARRRERNRDVPANAIAVSKASAIRDFLAQERGYADWADYEAQMAKRQAERGPGQEAKPLTPAQERRLRERMEREAIKAERRYRAKQVREYERTDWAAFERGRSDGRTIGSARGVKGGGA